ncbi:DUF1642 domain-containing protein [Lacticaseibacillus rhamnosus]|uniref:DUF1642 domain-containing protein n=1 Tax=Lacticaseibacillus rhamnosus TaxID=47715 RepID=UPI003DA59C80
MSEEKMYAVKNAKGLYLSMSADTLHRWREGQIDATTSQRIAHDLCTQYGGHVVTFVEEPKKVVLTNEQAEIVEDAHEDCCPAMYISKHGLDEQLLINAYVNGYTVAEEKKYNVKVPHTDDSYFYKVDDETCNAADSFHIDLDRPEAKFTKLEIDHYHLQDFKKEEVTDDGTK